MKALVVLITLFLAQAAFAQKTGVGVSLGNPTGLNGKYWLSGDRAVDAGLALSFGKHSNASIHSDYLLHNEAAFYFNDTVPLDLYYGIGGRMEFADEIELGVRIPVGLVHKVEGGSADMFAEVAPIVDFVGRTGVELHWLFGGRYYF